MWTWAEEWWQVCAYKKLCFNKSYYNPVKVTQPCLTLCDPMDCTVHEYSLGQTTGVGSLSLLQGIFPSLVYFLTLFTSLRILFCRMQGWVFPLYFWGLFLRRGNSAGCKSWSLCPLTHIVEGNVDWLLLFLFGFRLQQRTQFLLRLLKQFLPL